MPFAASHAFVYRADGSEQQLYTYNTGLGQWEASATPITAIENSDFLEFQIPNSEFTATGSVQLLSWFVFEGAGFESSYAVAPDNAFANSSFDPDPATFLTIPSYQDPGPLNGTVSVQSDGTFEYTPVADFNGTDSFVYEVDDGNGGTDTATATINVAAVNDAPTFDVGDGIVTTPISLSDNEGGHDVLIQPDGQIVVTGYSQNGSNRDFTLVRYNADGTLDGSFGTGGIVVAPTGAAVDLAQGSALQPDSSIVFSNVSRSFGVSASGHQQPLQQHAPSLLACLHGGKRSDAYRNHRC